MGAPSPPLPLPLPPAAPFPLRSLQALFFCSGIAGLIYEVVWTRLLAEVFGSTALAMTAVFSVFLACLALGSAALGRSRRRGPAALVLYGWLEIGIALLGLASSTTLLLGKTWLATSLPVPESLAGRLALEGAATLLLIGPPVLLMGGTLPIAVNAAGEGTPPRQAVTALYGWNTVGAAVGALSAGYLLIWVCGLPGTILTACGLNLAAGLWTLLRLRAPGQQRPGPGKYAKEVCAGSTSTQEDPPAPDPTESSLPEARPPRTAPSLAGEPAPEARDTVAGAAPPGPITPLPAAASKGRTVSLASGLAVFGYEMLWGRLAKFLLGDRTLAISTLLFTVILGLGLGSLLAPRLARRLRCDAPGRAPAVLAALLVGAALLHLLFAALARKILALPPGTLGASLLQVFWGRTLVFWLLVLPPMLVLGLVFPLQLWSARSIDLAPGRVVARLYLVNTLGGLAGAFLASYAFARILGTLGGFAVLSLLLAGGGGLYLLLRVRQAWARAGTLGALALAVAGAAWLPKTILEPPPDEILLARHEDEYGVQTLTRTRRKTLRVRNNRLNLIYELGHPNTAHAQQMAAHLTVLLGEGCAEVLNIGTGYGITAGTFTLYPDVRTLETVELLPFLVRHQGLFSAHNFDYLGDPRTRLIQGDGRHFLAASPRTYDILSVNVLDPYLPGSSSLYTTDFWLLARARLKPGGVYTQLFWGQDLPLLVKGLRSVFPAALYFPAYGGTAFNVVAFRDAPDPARLKPRWERLGPRARAALRAVGGGEPEAQMEEGLPRARRLSGEFEAAAREVPGRPHSDLYPILEYRWTHGVEGVSILDSPLVGE